jgi:methionyl-tRNA synthetase
MVWSAIWKIAALWKSARRGSFIWFIILFLVNTVGILEILYIFVFSEMKALQGKPKPKASKKKSKKK